MEGRHGRIGQTQTHTQTQPQTGRPRHDQQKLQREAAQLWQDYQNISNEIESSDPEKVRITKPFDVVKSITFGGFIGTCSGIAVGTLMLGGGLGVGLGGAIAYGLYYNYRSKCKQEAQEKYVQLQQRSIKILSDLKERKCLNPDNFAELERLKKQIGSPEEKAALKQDLDTAQRSLAEVSAAKGSAEQESAELQQRFTSLGMELDAKEAELNTAQSEHVLKLKKKLNALSEMQNKQAAESLRETHELLKTKVSLLQGKINPENRRLIHENLKEVTELLETKHHELVGKSLASLPAESDMETSLSSLDLEQPDTNARQLIEEMAALKASLEQAEQAKAEVEQAKQKLEETVNLLGTERNEARSALESALENAKKSGSDMQVAKDDLELTVRKMEAAQAQNQKILEDAQRELSEKQLEHTEAESAFNSQILQLKASVTTKTQESEQALKDKAEALEAKKLLETQMIAVKAATEQVENDLEAVRRQKNELEGLLKESSTENSEQKKRLLELQENEGRLIQLRDKHFTALGKVIDRMFRQLQQLRTVGQFRLNAVKRKGERAFEVERRRAQEVQTLLDTKSQALQETEQKLTLKQEELTVAKKSSQELEDRLKKYQQRRLREFGEARDSTDFSTKNEEDVAWGAKFDFDILTEFVQEVLSAKVPPSDLLGYQAALQLDQNLEVADQRLRDSMIIAKVEYVPDVETLPSLEEQRVRITKGLQAFTKEVKGYQKEIERCGSNGDLFRAKKSRIDSCLEGADAEGESRARESEEFDRQSAHISQLQDQLRQDVDVKAPKEASRSAINAFSTVLKHSSSEVRDYGAGAVAKVMREHFLNKGDFVFTPNDVDSLEGQRELLEARRKAILQMKPANLPLDMKKALSPRGEAYLNHLVAETTKTLVEQSHPQVLEMDLGDTTRNEPGLQLAQKMLADPTICTDVYTLLSSLKPSHENVTKSHFSYCRASLSGLEMIRQQHGLVYMPTMKELLTAVEHDLKQIDSKITTAAVKQHRGTLKNKNGIYRRQVLRGRCDAFLKLENALSDQGDHEQSPFRGQSSVDGALNEHRHKATLDCFAGANNQSLLIHDSTREMSSLSMSVDVYPVPDNPRGLMNAFFSGCNGEASLRVNHKTKNEHISITGGNTEPNLVFTKGNGTWQVSMGGKNWWVDPAFVVQNPGLRVPFEDQDHRDWVPVKDANNNTAILVLRKGTHDRYFLYEKGGEGTLEVRPISDNPQKERIEGAHLYWAATNETYGAGSDVLDSMQSMTMSLSTQNVRVGTAKPSTLEISKSNRSWVKVRNLKVLDEAFETIKASEQARSGLPRLFKRDLDTLLESKQIDVNPLRRIASQKRETSQRIGAKLETFHPGQARFGQFSVHATFDKVSDKFYNGCRERVGGESPIVDQQKQQRRYYQDNVFKALTVFSGCELSPGTPPVMVNTGSGSPEPGTPDQVQRSFGKVLKNTRDHCMRMTQQVDDLRAHLVGKIRGGELEMHTRNLRNDGVLDSDDEEYTVANPVDSYTDQQLLDEAVILFEKGSAPCGFDRDVDITDFVTWIQAENDLKQNTRKLHDLQKLNRNLERLVTDAPVLSVSNKPAYVKRCQQWNLEMALLASDMEAMQRRLDHKGSQTMNAATRAIMSFERRAETVLRSGQGSNQVEEVHQAMGEIYGAMAEDLSMARVSQLGTGWGKSTMVQLWSDYACGLNIGRSDRSVLVIAPTRNKKDLDGTLQRYFHGKGLPCGSLDLMNEYVKNRPKHGEKWWYGNTLKEIHNALLGVPRNLRPEQVGEAVAAPRGPVVASIQDVQILMHLRKGLQAIEQKSETEQRALIQLNAISDLLRESMLFADEWDSALIPPLSSELDEMVGNINVAVAGMPDECQASSDSIIHDHGAFIFGCKRKHLLSATTGTPYAAAVASGAKNSKEVAGKCNTDPLTTIPRVWHLLELAEPVFVDSSDNEDLKRKTYEHVVNRVGPDRPVLLFNSETSNGEAFHQAVKNQNHLHDARKQYAKAHEMPAPEPQGMMYYNANKTLCYMHPGNPEYDKTQKVVPMKPEDEAMARAGRGRDGCLSKDESVGTDAPQGIDSVGVVIGGLEQKKEGRLDLFTQQIGRVTRAMRSMHKPQQLFFVADRRAASELDESLERASYLSSFDEIEAARQELAQCFEHKKLPSAVSAAVEKPLKVKRALKDELEDATDNVAENLNAALTELEVGEYIALNLNDSAMKALIKVKRCQWEAKVKLVELLGAEFARRDVSPNIMKYEEMLEQAAVDSALDKAFSEEDLWCKGLDVKDDHGRTPLSDFEMEETSLNQLPNDPEIVRNVQEIVASKTAEMIGNYPRRQVQGAALRDQMAVQFDEFTRIGQMKEVFGRLKTEGITAGKNDPLSPIKPELKLRGMGILENTRASLKKIMDASGAAPDHEAAKEKAQELGEWSKLSGTGHQHNWWVLHPLMKELEAKMAAVAAGDVEESVTVDEFMDYFCEELSKRVNFIVVAISQLGETNMRQISKQVKRIFAEAGHQKDIQIALEVKKFMKLKGETAKTLKQGVEQEKAMYYPGATDVSDSLVSLNRLQIKTRQEVRKPKAGARRLLGGGHRVKDMETVTVLKPVTSLPVNETYGYTDGEDKSVFSLKDLRILCQRGRDARDTKVRWDKAVEFCDPKKIGFQRCLEELEIYLMKHYNTKVDEIKDDLRQDSDRIRQQHELMATAAAA